MNRTLNHSPIRFSLRNSLITLTSVTALLVSCAVYAQTPEALGEVRKVDVPAAKITLKHGEIKNLDMPPMTMTYRVKSKALLDGVQVGDKVRFTAEKIDGQYVVTTLVPAGK